jgi:hypothetical protein
MGSLFVTMSAKDLIDQVQVPGLDKSLEPMVLKLRELMGKNARIDDVLFEFINSSGITDRKKIGSVIVQLEKLLNAWEAVLSRFW